MKSTSLVYNDSLMNTESLINLILSTTPKDEVPTCKIEEAPNFYYINIDSFYGDKHVLEISYKNNFLILKMKTNDIYKKFLFERMFYLEDIDSNNILLHDYKNQIKLVIPKLLQS